MNFEDIRQCRVLPADGRIQIGDLVYELDESLQLDAPFENLAIRSLADLVKPYLVLSNGECQPQAAILIYELTGKIQALAHYFPILHLLNPKQQIEFHSLLQNLVASQNLRVVMKGMADTRNQAIGPAWDTNPDSRSYSGSFLFSTGDVNPIVRTPAQFLDLSNQTSIF